jgi:hypothetical protein
MHIGHRRGNPNFGPDLFCNYFSRVPDVVVLYHWDCRRPDRGFDVLLCQIGSVASRCGMVMGDT